MNLSRERHEARAATSKLISFLVCSMSAEHLMAGFAWAKTSMVVRMMLVTGSARPTAQALCVMQWAK
jgi:hypothetical protein